MEKEEADDTGPKKYVPPSMRKRMEQEQKEEDVTANEAPVETARQRLKDLEVTIPGGSLNGQDAAQRAGEKMPIWRPRTEPRDAGAPGNLPPQGGNNKPQGQGGQYSGNDRRGGGSGGFGPQGTQGSRSEWRSGGEGDNRAGGQQGWKGKDKDRAPDNSDKDKGGNWRQGSGGKALGDKTVQRDLGQQWRAGAGLTPPAIAPASGVDSDWRQTARPGAPAAVQVPKSREEELSVLRGITVGKDEGEEVKDARPADPLPVRALVEDDELEGMCFRPARAKK